LIATDVQAVPADGRVIRSALLRWRDGEGRLWIDVPAELAPPKEDASPLLPVCLLQAMRRHEDLVIEGPVSARMLAASDSAQAAYHAWDLSIRLASVTVAERRPASAGVRGQSGCFFSRGVDSMYAAVVAKARAHSPVLIFCERLDPIQGADTRAAEHELAAQAAGALDLPLAIVASNVREITDPLLDWGDIHGGALGFIALSLAGGLDHVIVPSTHAPLTVGPWGSSPLLDPLWSTEVLELTHGRLETRPAKLRVIARQAPTLLPLIKVCYRQDGAGNCGQCNKCLLTMVCLDGLGLLDGTTSFPQPLDPKLVATQRPANLASRLLWLDAYRGLSTERRHRELRRAIEHLLWRVARPGAVERLRRREFRRHPRSNEPGSFGRHRTNAAVSLNLDGEPYP